MNESDVALDSVLLQVPSYPLHIYLLHFRTSAVLCYPVRTLILTGPAHPSPRLSAFLLPLFSRSQSYSTLSTSVLSQPQPPPNIPAYHVALDGFVLRSICVECLTKHSRIEEAIYNRGRKP
jgi:hypothetical protein